MQPIDSFEPRITTDTPFGAWRVWVCLLMLCLAIATVLHPASAAGGGRDGERADAGFGSASAPVNLQGRHSLAPRPFEPRGIGPADTAPGWLLLASLLVTGGTLQWQLQRSVPSLSVPIPPRARPAFPRAPPLILSLQV